MSWKLKQTPADLLFYILFPLHHDSHAGASDITGGWEQFFGGRCQRRRKERTKEWGRDHKVRWRRCDDWWRHGKRLLWTAAARSTGSDSDPGHEFYYQDPGTRCYRGFWASSLFHGACPRNTSSTDGQRRHLPQNLLLTLRRGQVIKITMIYSQG